MTLARLIESGRYDKHLRRLRAVYAARRRALIDALAEHAPAVELRGLAAGPHLVACLPEGCDDAAIVTAARERSVGLYPMSHYSIRADPGPPRLVLGFGALSEPAIRRGVAAVADLLGGIARPPG